MPPDTQLSAILGSLLRCIGNLPSCGAVARVVLGSLLPDDAPARLNGRLTVAVAQLDAFEPSLSVSATWLISSWTSKEDLIDTLIASASIPCYNILSATPGVPGIYATLRGQPVRARARLCAVGRGGASARRQAGRPGSNLRTAPAAPPLQAIDGGFAATFEELLQHNPNTVSVSPTYARGAGVSPPPATFCGPQRAEPRTTKLFKNTLPPVAGDPWALDSLACVPISPGQFVPTSGYGGLPTVDPIPDIHPGTSLPVSAVLASLGVTGLPPLTPACLWNAWVLAPPFLGATPLMSPAQFNGALAVLGQADAAKWADDNGY